MSLVIFDLDGTLAPVGLPVAQNLADDLRALERAGHQVAICSGKPLAYLCGMLRQIGLKKPALAGENGAAVQLGIDLPPVHRSVIPYPESARQKLAELRAMIDRDFGGRIWYQPNEHMLTCFPHSDDLFEPIGQLIYDSGAEKAGLVVYRHCDCFDIIPAGVDKGAGLRELCRMLDFSPDDTVAVGDHDNDLPMFEAAGLSIGIGDTAPKQANLHFACAAQATAFILNNHTQPHR